MVVKHEDPGCPPLAREGVFVVLPVPSSGRLCTSTTYPKGRTYFRFEYVYADGSRKQLALHSGSKTEGGVQVWLVTYLPEFKWEENFIGTRDDAATRWGTPPDPWRQKDNPRQ
jgi:hypothetical protein